MQKFLLYEKSRETNQVIKAFLAENNIKNHYNDQLDRTITGMVLNIAEESLAIFDMLEDEGYIEKSNATPCREKIIENIKILTTLINKRT